VRSASLNEGGHVEISRSATVVEGVFENMFSEAALHKEAALIIIPPSTVSQEQQQPIQMVVYGGGIGECPQNQCIATSKRSS